MKKQKVTLIGLSGVERYGHVVAVDGLMVDVEWIIGTHRFSRATGKCVESAGGLMSGYKVASADLGKFAAKA